MNAFEQYITMVNTRNFLVTLSVADRADCKIMAQYLLKNFPSEGEIASMIRLQEEHYHNLWTQPKGNPIEYRPEDGGWIFWDETWTTKHGPFLTLEQAQTSLDEYVIALEQPPEAESKKNPFGFFYDKDAGGK